LTHYYIKMVYLAVGKAPHSLIALRFMEMAFLLNLRREIKFQSSFG